MTRTGMQWKPRSCRGPTGCGSLPSLIALITLSAIANGATIRVPADQPTLQGGIDAAAFGDTILVAPGTYTGQENKNLDLRGKDMEVRSEKGPHVTILDCENVGRAFFLLGPLTAATVIQGFTIRHGDSGADPVGGGAMFIAGGAPSIIDCIFERNRAAGYLQNGGGGAISVYNANPSIASCSFIENTVSGNETEGGALALHVSVGRITDCRFERNVVTGTRGYGGGVGMAWSGANPSHIENCDFFRNEAGTGGGAFLVFAKVTGCRFSANKALRNGGGASVLGTDWTDCSITGNEAGGLAGGCEFSSSTMSHCVILGNTAPEGGGLRCMGPAVVSHSVIARNVAVRGGGVVGAGEAHTRFLNCTIVDNEAPSGSGVYLTSWSVVTYPFENTIISGGKGGEAIRCAGNARAELSCSDVYGNEGGDWVGCIAEQAGVNGNLAADPRFCDPGAEDWHLCAESPCAPGQSGDCGLIGALDVGCSCPIAVEPATWGQIKLRGLLSGSGQTKR